MENIMVAIYDLSLGRWGKQGAIKVPGRDTSGCLYMLRGRKKKGGGELWAKVVNW
jgi:hypothetical protein